MRILGLDPANRCGWAHSCGRHGLWRLRSNSDDHPGGRLVRLRKRLYWVVRELGVDVIAAEHAAFGSRRFLTIMSHAELLGVIRLVATELNVPLHLFKPTEIKRFATGRGDCNKWSMIQAARTMFDVTTDDDNIADAVAVLHLCESKCKTVVPKRSSNDG